MSHTGKALHVEGKAHFSRSGKATVTAGHLSVTVSVPGGLSGAPLCFANLRSYRAGIAVAAVRPNYPSAGKMRIYLTKSVATSTSVAWWVADELPWTTRRRGSGWSACSRFFTVRRTASPPGPDTVGGDRPAVGRAA
jgi:hypothetical protein